MRPPEIHQLIKMVEGEVGRASKPGESGMDLSYFQGLESAIIQAIASPILPEALLRDARVPLQEITSKLLIAFCKSCAAVVEPLLAKPTTWSERAEA